MLTGLLENVFVRLVLYVLSTLPGFLAAWGLSWIKVSFDGVDWITIGLSVKGITAMLLSAVGTTAGVFSKFGTK